ncbi:FAD-binding oxidoreductase [Ammoniphilus sp. CFH 90114]|uniref:FAD-binding oxidoreductase n=1 Tax=Ammoniphilus sp. CFH 90114 TaxID=2493665 RepID=UPI00100FFB19|nr:FAD-binding oxidoreductase [Ammoniphilus sp. CFH 90114]RXT04520.1 FAD-binding oxidoreductase [Ammoniphilus sp. CFH 90114]
MKAWKKDIAGWGNYPKEKAFLYRPEKTTELKSLLASGAKTNYISRGLGRSYGDTALNRREGVILHTKFNRFLSFDPDTGVVECEAGVSLEEIIEVFLPRGYFLPVTPGTKYVTLGGAIANDVHGKNHHQDGAISDHLLDFTLMTASGELWTCSREENADLFWATVGGIGLTGIILTARLRLISVESAYIEVDYKKAANLDEALDKLAETGDQYPYSVAWIDCLATGRSMGRSVLMLGKHAGRDSLPATGGDPLSIRKKKKLNMPFNLPSLVLNPLSIGAFNALYYGKFKDDSLVTVDYDSFFYPLDAIDNWNRMYGAKGFIQYQMVFPPETSREGLTEVLERLSQAKKSSFLAVLKSFGARGNGWLSFPRPGYTLALDIPVRGGAEFISFIHELDQIVLHYGGVLYLAKDALMSPDTFRTMYPEWERFRELKEKVDPHHLFSSSMARRLHLTEDK